MSSNPEDIKPAEPVHESTRETPERETGAAFSGSDLYAGVPFEDVLQCVHCGLCLDACPTYRTLGAEQDSPRGRLYLMRGLWEGDLSADDAVTAPLSRCLDCRACETACPSGVPYGQLLEKTRGVLARHRKPGLGTRLFRDLPLDLLPAHTNRLIWFSRLMRLYRKLGLAALIARSPLSHLLPKRLVHAHRLLPNFSGRSFKKRHADKVFAPLHDRLPVRRVGLFTGCVMDVADNDIHEAVLHLLRVAGCEVVIPAGQTCCGALQVHAGTRAAPRALAKRNYAAFAEDSLSAVIVDAAGCGAQLKEYHHLFSDAPADTDPKWREGERWHRFGAMVCDILDFLAGIKGFVAANRWNDAPLRLIYDAPCHLVHAQRIDAGPRALLASLPGVELVVPSLANQCCGAAGIYNVQHRELAESVLEAKLDDLTRTLETQPEATVLVTANPGCLFQLRHGVAKRGLPLRVLHPAVLLTERLLPERA
ncbi:(Fe-S)-binding protein [Sulfidibacter corallicola]|uniref:Glycolate oxidase iron-sulfur subunit n=1 Tax=Sulfidibacter corallicola TaxID=2818388 RepID=A0A8A4TSA0_SULCO|nr:(Fe-S)-binding protein [Sulfidibacter corallicola]QTD51918.1 (Fe-S)-binding protein [Sulfidibacter corallicola]